MLPTLPTADHGAGFTLPSPDGPRAPPPQAARGPGTRGLQNQQRPRQSQTQARARQGRRPSGRNPRAPAAGQAGEGRRGRWVPCSSWPSGATVGPSRAHPGAAAGASAAASRDPPSSSREPAALPPAGQAGAGEPRCALRGSLRTGRRGRVAVSCVATGLVAGVKDGAAAAEKPGLISGASGGAGGKAWEWLWPEVAEQPRRCAGPPAGNGRRPHAGEEKAMRPCEPGVRCLRSGHSRGTRRGRPCARGRARAPAAVPTGRGGAVVSARPRGLCVRRTLFHESRGCGMGRHASSRPAPCVAVPSGALREAAVEAGVRPTAQRPGAPGREGVPGREAPRRPRGVCIWAASGPGFRRWRPKASGRSRPLRGLLRESVFSYLS